MTADETIRLTDLTDPADPADLGSLDDEDRAIQMRSFMALAWVAIFAVGFAWCVMEYMKEARTVDCITFVSAPNYAPAPGTCKREKKAFR